MSKIEDFNLLLKVAEKYGENPIDFYDGIQIVKQNNAETPMMKKSLADNTKYDDSIDPYKNACHYYRKCLTEQCYDMGKISLLDRNYILDQLAKKNNLSTSIFSDKMKDTFQQIIKETYDTQVQFKTIYIDLDYFRTKEKEMNPSINNEELISISKKVFRTMIEKPWVETMQNEIVNYINKVIDNIKRMGRKSNNKCMKIRINKESYSKIESLFADDFPTLNTQQILRGVYFFVYEGVVNNMNFDE